MSILSEESYIKWGDIFKYIPILDHVVAKIIDRPLSYAYERPQDFVTAILSVRAFRLTIGGLHIASSGYPDLTPNISRTVWEISLRLLLLKENPIKGSIGYLLFGVSEEIKSLDAEIEHRKSRQQVLGKLERNRKTIKEYHDELKAIAKKRGINPDQAQKEFGKINTKKLCKKYGIGKAYKVNFAFQSGFIHARYETRQDFYEESSGMRTFNMGLLESGCREAALDALLNLALVISFAAEVVEDKKVITETDSILREINSL